MHLQDIPACKDPGDRCLQSLVDDSATRDGIQLDTSRLTEFILWNKPDGSDECITRYLAFRSGNWMPVLVYLSNGHARHPLSAVHACHGVTQQQGDAIVIEALHDVACETRRVGHDLKNCIDSRPFQGEPPRHDEANVARSEDDNIVTGKVALHIHVALSRAGRHDARGSGARDHDGSSRTLAAAH